MVGQGRHGEAGHGAVRRGVVMQAGQGGATSGREWHGKAGVVRRGVAEYGGVRQAWHGGARRGRAWIG